MYDRMRKSSSSWNPSPIQKKKSSKYGPRTFTVQPRRDTKSAEQKERPTYSRVAADKFYAKVLGTMENGTQRLAQAQAVQRQSEQGEAPVEEAATVFQQAQEVEIQRQCSECQEEEKESDETLSSGVQTKLTIGAVGDKYEQEADRVAAQVMSMPVATDNSPQVQRFGEEDNPVQGWSLARSITPVVQRAFQAGGTQASGNLESRLNASKGGGSPLAPQVRAFMEPRFDADFSSVRVHTGSEAVQMNRELGAQAFAHGSDIYFGAGKSPGNNELTAHELTHVVQQSRRATVPDVNKKATSQAIQISAGTIPAMVQRDTLPVAKFSPAPGLFIDRTEKSVTISGAMELYGPEANAGRAASIQTSINTTWTRTFPDGYSVKCNITVTYRGTKSKPGNATQIEAAKISGPSHVAPGLSGRSMTLNANEPDAFTWTPAHEFGHIIGLDDRYSEGIMSQIKGSFGGKRTTTVQSGYEGNLMAVSGGSLESKNIKDIAEENEPSSYWINDDDQVRDWVNDHSLSDIGKLSTTNKLKAIKTLMGGWISDADVAAITRICSSVTSSTEANAIRNGVNLGDMISITQRTLVRLAFSKMP